MLSPMRANLRVATLALGLAACTTGSSNTLLGAGTMSAAAVGAAVVSRASHGCIAMCTNGTTCNSTTGLCEVLPCRGLCGSGEHCEQTFTESKCAPGAASQVTASVKPGKAATTIAPVTATGNNTSASPSVTPAAEQPAQR